MSGAPHPLLAHQKKTQNFIAFSGRKVYHCTMWSRCNVYSNNPLLWPLFRSTNQCHVLTWNLLDQIASPAGQEVRWALSGDQPNWTRSGEFQKELSNICLFYLGLIAVMQSKQKNNNTLKSYLLSNWKVFHLNFCRRYLHFAFQHWSKQNRLSSNLVKSLISHIDSEHNKVQFCWYLNYCSGFCFKRCCINFVMSWV